MIEKWYRGHEGSKNATDNFGIIWLADDPEYAQLYADEYPNGVVSTVFVNMDKINYLDWYYDEDFDPYGPDMFLLKNYMKKQGCNAYTFPLNDGITVLALLTTEPIVKVERTIIENKKYRNMKIRLTESKLKQIVAESVKKVLKESTGRCPDKYFGGYFFEGLGLDGNGNPIYCSEHLPLEAKKMLGWRKSVKYGMRGQADDWVVCHVLDELGLPRGNDEEDGYFGEY